MNIHFSPSGIRLQLNLSVCCSEALNFATQFANVISSGKGIKTEKVRGIDMIMANTLLEINNGFSVKCWQKKYTPNC